MPQQGGHIGVTSDEVYFIVLKCYSLSQQEIQVEEHFRRDFFRILSRT